MERKRGVVDFIKLNSYGRITANGFVTVEYRFASSGNLRRLPKLAKRYSSTVTDFMIL